MKLAKAVGLVMACCLTCASMADLSMPVQAATQDNDRLIQVGDDVYATLDVYGTLTISGTGDMWDNDVPHTEWNKESSSPWFGDWEQRIKSVVIEDGVTSIGDYAFVVSDITVTDGGGSYFHQNPHGLSSLQSVKIGSGVKRIGEYAFYKTPALSSIKIPGNVKEIEKNAFYGSRLENVKLQNGIEKIDSEAFCHTDLKAVDIPGSVKTIESNAFVLANLTDVTIQQGVGIINNDAFDKVHAKILSRNVVLAPRAFLGGSTITCYKGSTAARYAVSNNMTVKYITEPKTLKKSPKPSVKIKGGVMKITCKAVTGADGYQVRYATNASMKKAVTISGSKASVAKLKKGKTYYVQARAYKKGAKKTYGAWSDKVKVDFK
ncbi:MAG: leucine-rich repeat domain-containing protein [Lachnospiraceae bacterium]|nr:leucine-rich repeat domain-containing protein [Lachnospiraceae bacterium]